MCIYILIRFDLVAFASNMFLECFWYVYGHIPGRVHSREVDIQLQSDRNAFPNST